MRNERRHSDLPRLRLAGSRAPWTFRTFGEVQTIGVPPDPETLRQIAEQTGGQFFEAPTEADLEAVYE